MPGGSSPGSGGEPGPALPRWNLDSIYTSFDADEYRRDMEMLKEKAEKLLRLLDEEGPSGDEAAADHFLRLIRAYEEAGNIAENLEAYVQAVYTTDTRNARALAEINAVEALSLPLGKAAVLLRNRLAGRRDALLALAETHKKLIPYRFFITEALEKAAYQMAPEMEDLANDLSRSGGDAWGRLQDALSSTATALWDSATGERRTAIALRDLAHDPDRKVRERAYRAELEAWKSVEIPMAAALNGVKGSALTADTRRGWPSVLAKSAFQSRISGETLSALIAALESSLPMFRRYLKAKASLLGIQRCAFYDLFAPVLPAGDRAAATGAAAGRKWSWDEACAFIAERFDSFDPGMGSFARHAFALSWIDAEGRPGKVGGAYCTDFPLTGESRILCNFEGSFDSVTTLAHELGHAWHHELLKTESRCRAIYPMTLAETASIFAETIVFEDALSAAGPAEKTGLIEGNLKDSCQVIVDILSRFYFERELFERRGRAELSPEELCALMSEAQVKSYGEGLDPSLLHPYMWAVKGHYYSPALGFYNYPYAFGLLFSLALYSRYREEGPRFAPAYRELLRLTGRASAEEVGKEAGFDIRREEFWRKGIGVIEDRVDELEALAGGRA